jgi:transposase-like protein
MKKEFVSYSEAFKMQVVKELGQGKFATILQAQKTYGIRGTATIQTWIKKYGMEELLPKRVRVETMTEIDELKEAKNKLEKLEAYYTMRPRLLTSLILHCQVLK